MGSKGINLWEIHKFKTARFIARNNWKHSVSIETKQSPMGIVFIGDVHLDASGCNLSLAEKDAELIRKSKNVVAVLTGDIMDLSRLKPFGFHSSQPNSSEAKELVSEYLRLFGGKLLAVHSGNHDEWSSSVSGVELMRGAVGDLQTSTPCFSAHRMLLDLKLNGKQRYRVFSTHQTKYGSGANPLLGPLNSLKNCNDVPSDVDIMCISHRHTKFAGVLKWKEKQRVFLSPGTYKVADDLFDRECMNKDVGPVGVVLFGDRRGVIPTYELSDLLAIVG